MLLNGCRESTYDIDFIEVYPNSFVLPDSLNGAVNSDIMILGDLNLDYNLIKNYTESKTLTFGNLTVRLANSELLLALKYIAINSRMSLRDRKDLIYLYQKSDINKTYSIYRKIFKGLETSFEEFKSEIITEVFISNSDLNDDDDLFNKSTLF